MPERPEDVEKAVLTATPRETRWIPVDEGWTAFQIAEAVKQYATDNRIKDIEIEVVAQLGVRVKRVAAKSRSN